MNESEYIRSLLDQLIETTLYPFPETGQIQASTEKGVYIIYDSDGKVLHIGNTPQRNEGLNARLQDHLKYRSSFCRLYAMPNDIKIPGHCCYKFLVVKDARARMLLQSLAIGVLCPAHIATREKKLPS